MSDRDLALGWLSNLQARDESTEFFEAEAFAIIVTTEESGPMTWVHGPVADYTEALRLAEKHETELNQGLAEGDAPFVAKVYPMNKPEWD